MMSSVYIEAPVFKRDREGQERAWNNFKFLTGMVELEYIEPEEGGVIDFEKD